jgi:GNAT superfamily N-acetyltransferase
MYVLMKSPLQLQKIDARLELEFPISEQTYEIVDGGLGRFNNNLIPTTPGSFAVFLRDGNGTIVGGAVASTIWGWCDLMWMWVAESLRGQGWGTKLLDALHAECRRQGLWWIMSATNEFQALPFYQRSDYRIIAELPHFPPGYTHYFLQKRLKDE